jgi:hypothetical protein
MEIPGFGDSYNDQINLIFTKYFKYSEPSDVVLRRETIEIPTCITLSLKF